ncbi:MAG: aminoglycoside phosphotransferase family protein [Coriobacteriales bacterium]|nr:aminoglycoside phosphotransferase family protein [Coriobacteriales bacterium]
MTKKPRSSSYRSRAASTPTTRASSKKILREREVSRKVFVRGIPSAISFELVRVGDSYGIIYEMVRARTLSQVFQSQPERLEEYATRMAALLRTLHTTEFEEGELPDARQVMHMWVSIAERSGMCPAETIAKMRAAIDAIPSGNKFIHGDFHTANIMVTDDGELVLIDMGDASMGDPLIDLALSAQIMLVMQQNPQALRRYTSLDPEQMSRVWNTFIRAYCDTDDDARIGEIERRLELTKTAHPFLETVCQASKRSATAALTLRRPQRGRRP